MTLDYDTLVKLLTVHGAWSGDTAPWEALYVQFGTSKRVVKDTITHHTVDGSLVAIDIDEDGKVLGIELT